MSEPSGKLHVLALTSDGDLYGWGENRLGQVGCGNNQNRSRPVRVMQNVLMVKCGDKHTAALQTDGTVWCWGDNNQGQLGLGHREIWQNQPLQVTQLKNKRVVHIDCGLAHTVALTDQSLIYHWGTFKPNLTIEKPCQISLNGIRTVSVISGSYDFISLTSNSCIYRFYYDIENTCHCDPVELTIPVLTGVRIGHQICLRLVSEQAAILRQDQVIYTTHSSMADACALYVNPQETPLITNLPRYAIDDIAKEYFFNNPTISDFILYCSNDNPIYLNKKLATRRSPYLATQIDLDCSEWITSEYAVWFTWLRYLHTGVIGVIEPWWIDQLLALAMESKTSYLRDYCLHRITTHEFNGSAKLTQSEYWPIIVRNLDSNLTMANCTYYLELADHVTVPTETLLGRIWRRIATRENPPNERQVVIDSILKFVAKESRITAQKITNALRVEFSNNNDLDQNQNPIVKKRTKTLSYALLVGLFGVSFFYFWNCSN